MSYKRVISLFLAFICLCTVASVGFYAEGETEVQEVETMPEAPTIAEIIETEPPTEPPTEAPTVKPTQKPTEPPLHPKSYGYDGYAKRLDKTVYSDNDLGANYTPDYTNFKLWAPTADEVKVCIYKTGSDEEEGFNTIAIKPMKFSKTVGTWYITLPGDYKNMYYTYKVTANGETHEVVDPYAKSAGVNGNRGMILDLRDTDPEGWKDDSFKRVGSATDAVVWEVSVRDFSADPDSGVSEANRGKFLAFTEEGTTYEGREENLSTCVSYLKELGVNYVQINPFYDFASIDESKPIDDQYNWGYDPKNYNVPEGSYSSNPYDGITRVKECKQMIQSLHKAGIGVIMDVVYNHTYFSEDSFFHHIVPFYYHRFNEDGSWSNGSGCGNDVATERFMVSKLIRDSVKYWASEYHIDGFRFDLMGLMDVGTMQGIRADLNTLPDGEKILMYGEAWNMQTTVQPDVKLANQSNMYLLPGIGAFNDTGRDAIKGSNFNAKEPGFVQKGSSKSGVRSTVEGDGGGWAKTPDQCVNYASCHDNLTLYDKLTDSVHHDGKYSERREDLVKMNRLTAAIVLMSNGMPFMLAGEEMARTKQGDENSYISSVEINQIDWKSRYKYATLTDYYSGLIAIRKAVPALRDGSAKRESLETDTKSALAYSVAASGSASAVVIYNGDQEKSAKVTLPVGAWVQVADGEFAGLRAMDNVSGTIMVPAGCAAVLIDKEGFASVAQKEPESVVYMRYTDKKSGEVICEERLEGKKGESYTAEAPSALLFNYNIVSKGSLNGSFNKLYEVVNVPVEQYEGDYSTVTIRFLSEKDKQLADTIVMTNRVGQRYFTPTIPGVKGYSLDLDNLPDNAAGNYTDEPIDVVFRYKQVEEKKKEDKKVDGDYQCRANVIYLAEDGKILDRKSYMGVEGDKLELEILDFDGYEYFEESNSNALFTPVELNVLVYYQKPRADYLIYILIAGGAIVLLGVIAIILRTNKKRKMKAISIDD